MKQIIEEQKIICKKYEIKWVGSPMDFKVGIAENVRNKVQPINGLRHPIEGDTTGWYIWGGEEFSDDPNFFQPLHVKHLKEWCPSVLKYLGLPPGWRFLVSGEYEDVWEDLNILNV